MQVVTGVMGVVQRALETVLALQDPLECAGEDFLQWDMACVGSTAQSQALG